MLTLCASHASLLATSAYRPVARSLRSVSLSAVAPEGLPFESLSSLRPELLAGTQRLGYTALTDIQERALPPALAGRDVVGKAKTGSGKTVVFGLALLQRLDMRMSSAGRPQALVLSPTRELAQQLVGAVRGLAVGLDGTRVVAVTGGAISRQQRDAIAVRHTGLEPRTEQVCYSAFGPCLGQAGVHVVIGTPGRVLAMLDAGYIDPSALRTLVLDEADTLLNMGFEEEVRRILLLPPASCLLPTASCLLPTADCLLPTAYCPLTLTLTPTRSTASSSTCPARRRGVTPLGGRPSSSPPPGRPRWRRP